MLRAVLLGCFTTLLTAALAWYGWLDPGVRADADAHFYPPVALPASTVGVEADGETTQVALRMPAVEAVLSQPESTPSTTELLPDLRIRAPADIALIGSRSAGTLRLKFTTTIWNDGDGPVEVRGSQSTEAALQVIQYVHRSDGDPLPDRAVGSFDFEHRHGHLHLGGFARYELWSLDQAGGPVEVVAENAKVGFCLMDNLPIDESRVPDEPVYANCDAEVQGISVGYGDIYVAALYEQDLNVSGLADGRYRLMNIANPGDVVRELSVENNSAYVDIILDGGRVVVAGP